MSSSRLDAATPPPLGEDGWRVLVEQVKDYAIFMMDTAGRNASWNEGVGRVLGYGESEFVGSPMGAIFTPEDRAAGVPEQELATAMQEGSANDDRWLMRKDGARFWATGITTALRGDDGGLLGFTKVLRDHTDEKRLDEERRTSGHRLLTALAAARMGTWEWEIATNVERFDEGLARLFGVESKEITTLNDLLARVHPDDRAAVATAYRQSAESGADLDVEFRVVRPDGSTRWLRDHGKVLYDRNGDPLTMTGACVDITERRQMEAQLGQVQRMDAVGRLAGGVAHEVNNMMTAILGFTDLLLDPTRPGDPRRADLLQIRKAAGRAATVTAQLLAFSRRQLLQPRTVDLNLVITELHPMLLRLLGEDKQLTIQLEPDLWPVHTDRGQLEQALINLALNARDAMPQGGRLAIESANVELEDAYLSAIRVPPSRLDLTSGWSSATPAPGFRRRAVPHLRAVLHDEADGPGHRTGAVHGLRAGEAERWVRVGLQRAGTGHRVQAVPAPGVTPVRGPRATGEPRHPAW